ncbi:MAG: PadR family transcriptional regulator, partial [Gemmatimonadales bacterium]
QELRESDSGGRVLGPGTLYRVLRDLAGRGLITSVDVREDDPGGPPRRYYRLTALGQRAVAAEARRLSGLLERARPLLQ